MKIDRRDIRFSPAKVKIKLHRIPAMLLKDALLELVGELEDFEQLVQMINHAHLCADQRPPADRDDDQIGVVPGDDRT